MPFPLSSRGRVTLDLQADPSGVVEAVRSALAAERPITLTSLGLRIEFRGGILAGGLGNWHLLQPISAGMVEVVAVQPAVVLGYELRFRQLLALSAVGSGLVGALLVAGGVSVLQAVVAGFGAWLWTFGGNYAITAFRFRAFLRRSALQAGTG